MIETSDLRKQVKHTIEQARRHAAAHRAAADLASSRFEAFARDVAGPVFRQCAGALKAEGHPFQVFTPSSSLRLASERSGDDFTELALDTSRDPVALVLKVSHTRGRHLVEDERVVHQGPDLDTFSERDVLRVVLDALRPFVER